MSNEQTEGGSTPPRYTAIEPPSAPKKPSASFDETNPLELTIMDTQFGSVRKRDDTLSGSPSNKTKRKADDISSNQSSEATEEDDTFGSNPKRRLDMLGMVTKETEIFSSKMSDRLARLERTVTELKAEMSDMKDAIKALLGQNAGAEDKVRKGQEVLTTAEGDTEDDTG